MEGTEGRLDDVGVVFGPDVAPDLGTSPVVSILFPGRQSPVSLVPRRQRRSVDPEVEYSLSPVSSWSLTPGSGCDKRWGSLGTVQITVLYWCTHIL